MQIVIDIADADTGRVLDAFAAQTRWEAPPLADDATVTASKTQNCRDVLGRFINDSVRAFETQTAADAAREKAFQAAAPAVAVSVDAADA